MLLLWSLQQAGNVLNKEGHIPGTPAMKSEDTAKLVS